ncbi:MAG: prepilin-type N-terminal cleavage/methylation domain-containing protein [Colwellia sp.]
MMKTVAKNKSSGFTLVELMIALVISSFLLIGIIGTYSTIHGTIQASKELENAQEVIRYSSQVFTRSLKQTEQPPNVSVAQQLTVQQPANVIPCTGVAAPVAPYQETYTFNAATSELSCQVDSGNITILLQGITNITYTLNAAQNLVSITVQPTVLPENFVNGEVRIDIALTNVILRAAMPAS